jgi:hypothetical protein
MSLLILSIFFGLVIWFGWSLYGSGRSQRIKWKRLPKRPITFMVAIISFLYTSPIFSYLSFSGKRIFVPFSYPLRLGFRETWFDPNAMGEWFIGFIFSEFGFSIKIPIPFHNSTVFLISFLFFVLNYVVTIFFLNFFSKRLVQDVDKDRRVGLPEFNRNS